MKVDPRQIRIDWAVGDDERDGWLTTPETVERFDDIQYGDDPNWQLLDLYRPKKYDTKLPVIISIHGGAWVYGDKERYQYYCLNLAEEGFAVVNFTYRLADEFQFPAPLEDACLVTKWIYEHAEEYDLDIDHIFGVGDSAGGHLIGLYSCFASNPAYKEKFSFEAPEGFRLSAVALNCGIYELNMDGKDEFIDECIRLFLTDHGTPEELETINVLKNMTPDFPPSFVMTALGDCFRKDARDIKAKLDELGVYAEFHEYGTEERPLGHVFHCDFRQPEARMCNHEECDFFKTFCIAFA